VYCPFCKRPDSRVIDSRTSDDGAAIRRRRSCPGCGRRFTTQETIILTVSKRSGVIEPFNRDKIIRGVRRACQGRPVSEYQLALLAQQVEDTIRTRGSGEVPSHEIGLAILGPLRDLDEVAYLRFASVYRGFESLADFEDEIAALRVDHRGAWSAADAQFLADAAGVSTGSDRQAGLAPGERVAGRPPGERAAGPAPGDGAAGEHRQKPKPVS
jgi:transcriptional repressor NrdR